MGKPFPDRLSVDPGSPFENREVGNQLEVFINGIRQINCVIEFCVSEGWLVRYCKTALGAYIREGDERKTERREGVITLEWKR